MRRTTSILSKVLVFSMAGVLSIGLGGCGDDGSSDQQAARPVPRPRPTPPPDPEPMAVDVYALLQVSRADPRVQFPEEKAPDDEGLARAVITLADALARGDADAMRESLTAESQGVLAMLVESGQWRRATQDIEVVRVVGLSSGELILAVQDSAGAYPLKWNPVNSGESTTFAGVSAPAVVLPRASAFDDGIPEVSQVVTRMAKPEVAQPGALDDLFEEAEDTYPEVDFRKNDGSDGPIRRSTPAGTIEIPGTDRRPKPLPGDEDEDE